jgi:hypothetical protein
MGRGRSWQARQKRWRDSSGRHRQGQYRDDSRLQWRQGHLGNVGRQLQFAISRQVRSGSGNHAMNVLQAQTLRLARLVAEKIFPAATEKDVNEKGDYLVVPFLFLLSGSWVVPG